MQMNNCHSPPGQPFPQYYYRTVQNISLARQGQVSQLCLLPTARASLAHSLARWCEKQKRLLLCVSPARRQLKYPWVTNSFQHKSKAQPHVSYCEGINSIPARISTASHLAESVLLPRRWIHVFNSLFLQGKIGRPFIAQLVMTSRSVLPIKLKCIRQL